MQEYGYNIAKITSDTGVLGQVNPQQMRNAICIYVVRV